MFDGGVTSGKTVPVLPAPDPQATGSAAPTTVALTAEERSRVEGHGKAFIAAVNSDSVEARTAAVPEVFSRSFVDRVGTARLLALLERLRTDFGVFEYHHSEVSELDMGGSISRVLHVYARSKGAATWKDFQFRIEPGAPYRISELVFIADVAEPVFLPNGALADPSTLRWLNSYIDKLVAENSLSGSVLVAVGDKPIYERYFGSADAEGKVKVTETTRFNLGSGNKMFTALAVAQLVEQGKLKYSDPILKFFPDFPDRAFAARATVHHLLSHTSGVREYWTDEYDRQSATIRGTADMLPWVYKVGVEFEPGTQYSYSNSNFVLAGLIVEKAGGEDYYEYVRRHITGPLGMTSTDWYARDGKTPEIATPLMRSGTAWVATPPGQSRGSSAGGGYSTPRDMLKFGRGLVGGKIVRPETLRDMTTAKSTKTADAESYGYGFILRRGGQMASYGHGGIARGVNFEFRYFPAVDVTIVVFSNQDNGAYDDLRKNITKLVTGER